MKNKLIAKSLLTIAAIGITTTTIASTADASEGYGPREKKPVSINHNIVEYNDGTFKYQSRPKFNSTPKYIKFKHDYNILEFNDGTFEYGARPQFNKPAAKTDATIKKNKNWFKLKILWENLKKHILSVHTEKHKGSQLSFVWIQSEENGLTRANW